MASVGANAHEQPRPAKWLRRLSWCSYCLRIAAYSCRVSTRVICATGHAPVRPFKLAPWWVPLLPNTRRIYLSTVCNGCSRLPWWLHANLIGEQSLGIGASPLPEMSAVVGRRYLGAWLPLAGKHGSAGRTVACTCTRTRLLRIFWDVVSTCEHGRGFLTVVSVSVPSV